MARHLLLGLSSVSQPGCKCPQGSQRLSHHAQGEVKRQLWQGSSGPPRLTLRVGGSVAREWSFQPLGFVMGGPGEERPEGPQHTGGRVLLPLALWANPFMAGAAEAAASCTHSTLGGGRPTPEEAWEMDEVVRLVSGAGLGIHAGWQALVGEDRTPPAAPEATPGRFVFRPPWGPAGWGNSRRPVGEMRSSCVCLQAGRPPAHCCSAPSRQGQCWPRVPEAGALGPQRAWALSSVGERRKRAEECEESDSATSLQSDLARVTPFSQPAP